MRQPSPTRRKRLAIPASIAAFAVVGAGTLVTTALFTDTDSVDDNTFTAGTISLSADPATTAFQVTNMTPGDVVTAPLTIENDGSLELRYAMTSTANGDLAPALTLQVKSGVTDCTSLGFGASGTNLYGAGSIGAPTGTPVFGDSATGPHTGDRVLAPSANEALCVQVTLPGAATDNGYQQRSANATFTFNSEQTKNNGEANTGVAEPKPVKSLNVAVANPQAYTLTWSNPAGVEGVHIYRSSDGTETWNKVAEVPDPTTTWTDENPGIIPTYAVVSYGDTGTTSGTPDSTDTPASTPPPLPSASGQATLLESSISSPYLLAADANTIYSATSEKSGITRTDRKSGLTTHVATSVNFPAHYSMTLGPDGYLYMPMSGTNTLAGKMHRVNPTTGATTVSSNYAYSQKGGAFGADGNLYLLGTLTAPSTAPRTSLLKYDVTEKTFSIVSTPQAVDGSPILVAAGPDGYMYGVGGAVLFKFNLSDGTFTKTNLTSGGAAKSFSGSGGSMAYGPDGYLYASNPGDNSVNKIDPATGEVTRLTTLVGGARHVAITPDGALYAAAQSISTIHQIDTATGAKTDAIVGMQAKAMVYGTDGTLYTMSSDPSAGYILKSNPISGRQTVLTSGFPSATGLTWGGDGMLYAAARNSNAVVRVDPKTGETLKIATVTTPVSITYSPDGNLYTTNGSTIHRVSLDGSVTPVATVYMASGIAYGPDGFLYVGTKDYLIKVDPATGTQTQLGLYPGESGSLAIIGNDIFGTSYNATNSVYRTTIGSTANLTVAAKKAAVPVITLAAGRDGYLYLGGTGVLYKMAP